MRRSVRASAVLLSMVLAMTPVLPSRAGEPSQPGQPAQDACQRLLQRSATDLQQTLEGRLARSFPIAAQLEEGNARLAVPSILGIDCDQRHAIVSGGYEFRGNLGVMDITRRGAVVVRLHMTLKAAERQVWLDAPEVMDITFDNPAPWFDGKAIGNWALSLFSKPLCAHLQNGRPC